MKYSQRTSKNVKMSSFSDFLFYVAVSSGVPRGLSLAGKFSLEGPTGHCTGPTSQYSEKKLEK